MGGCPEAEKGVFCPDNSLWGLPKKMVFISVI